MLQAGTPVMEEDTRTQANIRMRHILQHCEAAIQQPQQGYNHPALVRLTHDYARSDDSKRLFLSSFFGHLDLPLAGGIDPDIDFSDPQAASNRTPQPSPITHSAVQRAQGAALHQSGVGTPDRVSTLRGTCLVRDRHRCVISRKFDTVEGRKRREAGDARDDDGLPIGPHDIRLLEVAHILPHSLVQASNSQLSTAQKAALDILNMFDMGVVHLIDGVEIDRPYNAITLSHEHHFDFGSFRIFFEPVSNQPHTYRIDAFDSFNRATLGLPVTRTLYLSENRTIDPPSPRLLAIHCAIGHILHLSGAGDYIDRIFYDAEEYGVRSDGSTQLGVLLSAKLNLVALVGAQS
ncbi:hypothetical protein RB598_007869 [Gaeumannomyces tritici]